MPSERSAWVAVTLNHNVATTANSYAVAGVAGKIVKITAGIPVVATAGNVALAKNAINLLSTANVALNDGFTAGEAKDLTLVNSETALRVEADDILKAVWTVTTGGSYAGGACTVYIMPDVW